MKSSKYLEDLKEIKDLMNKSSKFISLSGWSGICIGMVALIAAFVANYFVEFQKTVYSEYNVDYNEIISGINIKLLLIALITLLVSLLLGTIFTYNKSKRIGQKIWNEQSKILLLNLTIPLSIGGLGCLILFFKGYYSLVAPFTLIFYGLSLINASKYTLNEIRSLGITNCILGLIGLQFIGYGLLLWAIGFGVLHIVYGIVMKIRHN